MRLLRTIILGAMFLIRLVENADDRLSARFSNRRPTVQKVQTTARFLLYILACALTVSLSVRLDPTALTVIGGALAFAMGFALRDLVASFIAGITIMFDRPFQVGDRVAYGGEYGDIVKTFETDVHFRVLMAFREHAIGPPAVLHRQLPTSPGTAGLAKSS